MHPFLSALHSLRYRHRDVLIDRRGGGGELRDAPTQILGNPRDPELSHPHKGGGGGGAVGQPATQSATQSATQQPKQYTRQKQWTSFQKGLLRGNRRCRGNCCRIGTVSCCIGTLSCSNCLGVGNAGRFLMTPPSAKFIPIGQEMARLSTSLRMLHVYMCMPFARAKPNSNVHSIHMGKA